MEDRNSDTVSNITLQQFDRVQLVPLWCLASSGLIADTCFKDVELYSTHRHQSLAAQTLLTMQMTLLAAAVPLG